MKISPSLFDHTKQDLSAGLVVFLVAIPLCLGIALASGAPLFSGIIAGIIGGIVVGYFSGSNLSVSGPAAGLTIIVLNAITQLGSFEAFLMASLIAGFIQLIAGYLRAGIIGHYFPSSVIKGMLAAIGIILILKQLPHFLGLHSEFFGSMEFHEPDGTNTFSTLMYAFSHVNGLAFSVGFIALIILIVWDKPFVKNIPLLKSIPGPLVAVLSSIFIPILVGYFQPDWKIAQEQFVSLPNLFDSAVLNSAFAFPDFNALFNGDVYVIAITLAVVASLESLLSIEAVDKLDPEKRRSPNNQELKAQGVGNIVSAFLGGLPITSVIVRSSANVNSGAKTKMAAIYHGIFLLVAVVLIPSFLNKIPLSALASVLLLVGYKLTKPALISQQWKLGKEQFIPFVATIFAILFTDLLIGIIIGLHIGAFFIIYSNYKVPFSVIENTHPSKDVTHIHIKLSEHVSFLNKANLQHTLEEIEDYSVVTIDGNSTQTIDIDILEILHDFSIQAETRFIKLNIIHLPTSVLPFWQTLNASDNANFSKNKLINIPKNLNFTSATNSKINLLDTSPDFENVLDPIPQ
jgi:MFS superfamily sulfate permease-like transporter